MDCYFCEMKKLLCQIIFAGLAALTGLTTYAVSPDEEDPYVLLVDEADREIAAANYQAAIARLQEAIAMRPEALSNALIHSNLGILYRTIDDDSAAMVHLDRALELAPGLTVAMRQQAEILCSRGNEKEALDIFTNILARDSTQATDYYYHGTMSLRTGHLAAAERDFARLQTLAPNDPMTYSALGEMYAMTSREREAIPYLRQAAAYLRFPEIYSLLAKCQIQEQDLAGASETLAEALTLYPDDADLISCRAKLRRAQFRNSEAEADEALARKLSKEAKR